MLTPGTILQNQYRIMRELGHGGAGTVYEAFDEELDRVVALKEVIVGDSEEARRAFKREASLLGNLRDRALPKVLRYFSEDGQYFLVMEFISGTDLAELLRSQGNPFSQSQVMQWASEVLRVLEKLHAQQPPILHGDIKPSNLMLTKQGEIFLLDFGCAKGVAGSMPAPLGDQSTDYSPFYAPLEQINGESTDPRSDLYSLGATLHRLLTGEPPKSVLTRSRAISEQQPDPVRPADELNPQVSSRVAAVIHRALAIDRSQRPASAAEMRKDLERALDRNQPIEHADTEDETTNVRNPRRDRFEVQIGPSPPSATPKPPAEKGRVSDGLTFRKRIAGSKFLLPLFIIVSIAVVILLYFGLNGKSVERRLNDAITRGNFFAPTNDNAYDLYRQLKHSGAGQEKLDDYTNRILPQLTKRPLELLNRFTMPGSDDPSISDWENAAQALNWARELKPSDASLDARASYCQGRIAYLMKQEDQALQVWNKAADSDKTWPLPSNGVGLIYLERKDYETARSYFQEAVRRDPNWAIPYNNIGASYYREGHYDSAKENYRKAVKLAPRWAGPHAWLGDIATKEGDNNEAQAQYGAVLDPDAVGSFDRDKIRSAFEKARKASLVPRASP